MNGDTMPEDGEEYNKLLAHAKNYLPFLERVMENTTVLGIQEEHLTKLRSLYEMVDCKRLSTSKLKSCQSVFCSLFAKYHHVLSNEEVETMNSKNIVQYNEGKNKTKLNEVKMISNKNDQNPNSKSELSLTSEMSVSSVIKNITPNNKLNSLELDVKQNNEPIIENIKNGESSIKNDNSMPTINDLPDFSDSRLRLNKFIGIAANASIEKLNKSNTSVSHSELAKQIYDDITKKNKDTAKCQKMLEGINLDNIDVNHVKQVIESIKKTKVIDTPPLPPSDVTDLGATNVKLISSINSNDDHLTHDNRISTLSDLKPTSTLMPNKSTNIREKLNNEINVMHKIGSLNEPKSQKFISALKPGTLLDLENSKVVRSSLHMESIRPVVHLNEKNVKTKPEVIITRDPRIKHVVQPSLQMNVQQIPISKINQNPGPSNIPPLMALRIAAPESVSSQQELPFNKLSGYNSEHTNFQSISAHTNVPLLNKKFSTEYNGNSNQPYINNCNLSTQNQYRHNRNDLTSDTSKNDFNQYSNQMYVHPVRNMETIRYRESSSHKSHNDVGTRRDPRSIQSDRKMFEPQYRNYREFKEAKYGKEINSYNEDVKKNKHHSQNNDRYRSRTSENGKLQNVIKTDQKNVNVFNSFGILNDTAAIKTFKIPKIKRSEEGVGTEIIGNFNSEKDTKTNEIKNNYSMKDTKTETIKNISVGKDTKTSKLKDNNIEKHMKVETIKESTTEIICDFNSEKDTKLIEIKDNDPIKCIATETITNTNIGKDMKTNKKKGSDIERDLKLENSKNKNLDNLNTSSNVHKDEIPSIDEPTKRSKPKKPKKYSKEKEFEKIVKDAVESLNDYDTFGPRTRTRSSIKKKEIPINIDLNGSQKLEVTTDNKKLALGECSKSLDNKLLQSTENVELIETGQNIISSTSKEPFEVDSLTEIACKSHKDNIVSSDEINSTADIKSNSKMYENVLMNMLSNPKLISILQDEEKMKKLNMLLDSRLVEHLIEDKSTNKNLINYEHLNIDQQKKMKKKMKKEKKKKRKMLGKMKSSISGEESSDEKSVGRTEIFDNSNNDGNTSSDSENSRDYSSTDQGRSKQSKSKKSKENYGKFEILKDKNSCETEIKDIKIVLAKFDRNIKKKENLHLNVSSNNSVQTNDETINVLKPKKPFLGPLSVKLAMEKAEIERCRLQLEEETKLEFKTTDTTNSNKNRKRRKKPLKKSKVKLNTNSKKLINIIDVINESNVTAIENVASGEVSRETSIQDEFAITEQNSKDVIVVEKNTNEIRSDLKKPRLTELDKLHADISEMYDCDNLLNVSNIRQCRTNKQIDYVNTNSIVVSKKNKVSSVEDMDLHNGLTSAVQKSKATLKPGKKSTLKLNNCKKLVKKNISKTVTTTIVKKKKKKLKFKGKKTKKENELLTKTVLSENSQLKNVSNKETIVEKMSKVLTANDFKDKSYFQTADHSLECKFCDYNAVGLNIVRHYKEQHYKEEVLPSRLSRNCAEILINESIKENFGLLNIEQFDDLKSRHINVHFKCIFCQLIFYDIITFYDHITDHTGEYRYKCKICEHVYPNENELEKHILEHSNYDKTDGISYILQPNPIQTIQLFGYLCSFCNYVQLHYNNILKHMTLRHFDEDKKSNGHWTVIRISMSDRDQNYDNSSVDNEYLVGCLPPIKYETSVPPVGLVSIKSEVCEQQEIDENPPESNNFILSPKLSTVSLVSSMSEDNCGIINSEYTLKENSKTLFVDGLRFELIDSILTFSCFASKCSESTFSTVVINDFINHVELNHQFLVWSRFCEACNHKIEMISEQYFLKDALKHIISHHLVLKKNKQSNMSNLIDLQKEQSSPVIPEKGKSKPLTKLHFVEADFPSDKRIITENSPAIMENLKQPTVKFSNACQTSAKPIVIEEISNDNSFKTFTTPMIYDIRSLSSVEINVNNASKINQDEHSDNNDTRNTNLAENMSLQSDDNDTGNNILTENMLLQNFDNDTENTNLTENMLPQFYDNDNEIMLPQFDDNDTENLLPQSEDYKCSVLGQVKVNDGVYINDNYFLVETDYLKHYYKKVLKLPMNLMKTKFAFTEMKSLPSLFSLFKCMDRACTKHFSQKELFKLHMKLHFSNIEKKKKNQQRNNAAEQFKKCIYCFREFEDADSLADHIEIKYSYCKYFCPYCFYRAYTHTHVIVHQSKMHITDKPSIIKLDYEPEMSPEKLFVVNFNEFVLPFICNVGRCSFTSFLHDDFKSHLNKEHQQCDKYGCYICANNNKQYFALQPQLLIQHFKLHNFGMYQCVYCLFGSEVIDAMLCHLAMEHFEYDCICVERSLSVPNIQTNQINNLKIVRLDQIITNGLIEEVKLQPITSSSNIELQKSNKKSLHCSDVQIPTAKTAGIDEITHSSNTIVITVPDRTQMTSTSDANLTTDNEFIMIDDVIQNNKQIEDIEITDVWSETKNNENGIQQSNDIIIIEDDEDDLLEISKINNEENTEIPTEKKCLTKHSIEKSSNRLKKIKRLAHPLIELDKLFVCNECGIILSNSNDFQIHLSQSSCFINGRTCPFCNKFFKTPSHLTEHVKLHGPDRFTCSVCQVKMSSRRAITLHLKVDHNITNLNFVPVQAVFRDMEKDEFIVLENNTVNITCYTCKHCLFKNKSKKIMESHMKNMHDVNYDQCNISVIDTLLKYSNTVEHIITVPSSDSIIPQDKISTKRKHIDDYPRNVNNKKRNPGVMNNICEDKTNTLSFSPYTVEDIPLSHIFSEPIGCSLCTYSTKVRSNLVQHLMGHKRGQDNTTKEIVNPVPIKSELMFDKMINLSASSFDAMNIEKIKIDELNEKIIEETSHNVLNMEIFPMRVPKSLLYKCPTLSCAFRCISENSLKEHILTIHPDIKSYICPHCIPKCILSQEVEINKIGFHLMHHGENLYKCQYCDYIDFNRNEMKTHMRNSHLFQITSANQSNIIVIRQTLIDDLIVDRSRYQARNITAQWICNICSSGIKYTENEITSHIFMAHNVSNMFKCPMCSFEHNDDSTKVFELHYKLHHPSVAVKSLKVFEKIADIEIEEQQKQAKLLLGVANTQEQLALESIEPSLVPPTCRGIPIDTTAISRTYNKSRGLSKSPKSTTKSSPLQTRKQKLLIDSFSINDNMGTITSNGLFACPKCNVFETMNIDHFREHLIKDVNYKICKCMECDEISDSPKKMAWHVKKHGTGTKYKKLENPEKLIWIEQVITHQNSLIQEFKKKIKDYNINSVVQKNTLVCDKRSPDSPCTNTRDAENKNNVTTPKLVTISNSHDEIIDLLDDSDDE